MKTSFLSLLIFFAIIVPGCKKENPKPSSTSAGTTSSFILLRNGNLFVAKKTIVTSDWTDYIQIEARSLPNQTYNAFNMLLRKDLQPGEYSHTQLPGGTFSLGYTTQGQSFVINHGTINILSNDTAAKQMEFQFEAELVDIMSTDNLQISNGKSTIYY